MPSESGKPLIVISYAHADEPEHPAEGEVKWLSFVTGYLKPAIKHGAVDLWIDRLMPGGADWEREIEQKIRACNIFILLVSRHSLSSDYVVDKEIAIVRERQARGEAVHFYPLLLTPTPKIALEHVRDKNLRPRDGTPLSDFLINERYRKMSDTADEIAEIAGRISTRKWGQPLAGSETNPGVSKAAAASVIEIGVNSSTQLSQNFHEIVDRDSLEGWLSKKESQVAIAIASRAALRVVPLACGVSPRRSNATPRQFSEVTAAIFQANALARARRSGIYFSSAADVAASSAKDASALAAQARSAAAYTAAHVASAAYAAAITASGARGDPYARRAADTVAYAAVAAASANGSAADIWRETRDDIVALGRIDSATLPDLPLWSQGVPGWAKDSLGVLHLALTKGEHWDVWIDWYEERLRGGSRGEDYELVFASVPQEEWDKGSAAANLWIKAHLPPPSDESVPEITDEKSLSVWLNAQGREGVVALAARAALRSVPAIAYRPTDEISHLASVVFRATAIALTAVKYPTRADELRGPARAAAEATRVAEGVGAAGAAIEATLDADAATAALRAIDIAASEVSVLAYNTTVKAGHDSSAAVAAGKAARDSFWEEIFADATGAALVGASALADRPLWAAGRPPWSDSAWFMLLSALPNGQGWEIWFDWYEQRQHGGSRGEEYELVFAGVPQDEWDKGPTAANAWIKAHLPKSPDPMLPADLPEPVANVESPWAYALSAKGTVTVTAGDQSFPFYPYFNSEREHRETLHACGVQAQRLLKKLLDGQYHNVRPEYAERLANYLDDLPTTAEGGSILLAYGDILNLRSDFEADFEVLPTPFATELRRVIENQFALNSFYDIVERHNEAIASGTRSRPFPKEAIRPLREFISENTPRYFESNVSEAQRSLDRAAPEEPRRSADDLKAAESSNMVQLPTPPGTPDVKQAHQRQTAANANAIWEVVVKGPAAIEGWSHLAHQLGHLVRPFLDYLR